MPNDSMRSAGALQLEDLCALKAKCEADRREMQSEQVGGRHLEEQLTDLVVAGEAVARQFLVIMTNARGATDAAVLGGSRGTRQEER